MKNVRANSGFTLIELITVILILGILAATALPKFMSVSDEAYAGVLNGGGGGFASAIALAHATWIAGGNTAAADVDITTTDTVGFNASGWPVDATANGGDPNNATTTAARCGNLWDRLLQSAPTGFTATAPSNTTCRFAQNATSTWTTAGQINYDTATGAVTLQEPSR